MHQPLTTPPSDSFSQFRRIKSGRYVSWSNCACFCNTNIGARNCIKTRILAKNKCCFIAGCSYHLAAGKGDKAYTSISTFNIEDHQVDLHCHFEGSTRRKGILAEYVDFVVLGWENMPRFVTTRLLCLEKCCGKELVIVVNRTGETEMKKVRIQGFGDLKWLLQIQCQKSTYHFSMRRYHYSCILMHFYR